MEVTFTDGPMNFGGMIFHGACNIKTRDILVDRTSGFKRFIKNLVHELGHLILPRNPDNRTHDVWDNVWIKAQKLGVI